MKMILAVCFALFANVVAGADAEWWQTGTMYQIYPRSFQDSDGDGTGDIKGITSRVPYLKNLGIGFVWLSPCLKSPMKDFGYDIEDYRMVDPLFGTNEDLIELIGALHDAGIKLLMDFVPNHTSDKSAWFKASRSSRTNGYRDWYIWRDPAPDGGPPNNWVSNFGGSAWTFDNNTQQYYYHEFGYFQPDLNYRNPAVREAVLTNFRFWLDHGVDGFRIDAVPFLLEDEQLRDEPVNPDSDGTDFDSLIHIYTQNFDGIHEITNGWRNLVDTYEDRVTIGEVYADLETTMSYYGTKDKPEFSFPFNFQFIGINPDNFTAVNVKDAISRYQEAMPKGKTGNWVVGNHDQHRVMSRLGNNTDLLRAMHVLLHTLPGVPTTYNGDEFGMKDVYVPWEDCRDPMCINDPVHFATIGRDPERAPLQWDCSKNGGFSTANKTWLPMAEDYCSVNVEKADADADSVLNMYRSLLAFRKTSKHILFGDFKLLSGLPDQVIAFTRTVKGEGKMLVVINFSADSIAKVDLSAAGFRTKEAKVVFASHQHTSKRFNLKAGINLHGGDALIFTEVAEYSLD